MTIYFLNSDGFIVTTEASGETAQFYTLVNPYEGTRKAKRNSFLSIEDAEIHCVQTLVKVMRKHKKINTVEKLLKYTDEYKGHWWQSLIGRQTKFQSTESLKAVIKLFDKYPEHLI